ncbi:MAG: hypothetical protein A2571_01905 [Candidatus Vogelbacteria bacterium RIFOXYD1_FULL_44_32]|uniref:Uncharacterized protein n=1 Tax=Candidatus Vogelbacteria bacterium RIFOXYD1_FULL_44_32 TaxID=1802438 RepID=A0A1G2QDI6_9BACT|nr:MAG: hypothetical protein A2571_01905 [Candidatus Vogelbacteria bacterium RIFOXYD1_FULL_44_32]
MEELEKIKQELGEIQERNRRVEADKAWETSWTRKILIAGLTYVVIVLFFLSADIPRPFVNAIVPTLGFILSTLSVPVVKRWWVKYIPNSRE